MSVTDYFYLCACGIFFNLFWKSLYSYSEISLMPTRSVLSPILEKFYSYASRLSFWCLLSLSLMMESAWIEW